MSIKNMSIKKMLLLATCLSLGACSGGSETTQTYMGGRAHPLADNSSVYAVNRGHQDRENCEGYETNPANMAYVPSCIRMPVVAAAEPVMIPAPPPVVVAAAAPPPPDQLLPVIRSYSVYFNFDRSNIRQSETETLNEISRDIAQYHPQQVTVTGHTDRSGPAQYNERLSERRAETVSKSLVALGVPNQVISEQARGETDLAVATADGVKLQENRRAMVDFRGQMVLKPTGAVSQR
jgi:outer membrane protein OmpA-like peptidoglycan-associated protein